MPATKPTMRKMEFHPLAERVLIRPAEPEAVSPGGIVIPDNAKEKQQRGIVMAVGRGRYLDDGSLIALECDAGDEVLFKRYAGNEVELQDEIFLVVEEKDVLGIIARAKTQTGE